MGTGGPFPGCKSAAGACRWPLTPIECRGPEWVGAIPPLPPSASMACSGTAFPFFFTLKLPGCNPDSLTLWMIRTRYLVRKQLPFVWSWAVPRTWTSPTFKPAARVPLAVVSKSHPVPQYPDRFDWPKKMNKNLIRLSRWTFKSDTVRKR